MNQKLTRLIAILFLVIPGIVATAGFLNMKDALFNWFAYQAEEAIETPFEWGLFLFGCLKFFGGVAFIAGWIFYRDRKHNYVAPRFREKKQPRPPKDRGDSQD